MYGESSRIPLIFAGKPIPGFKGMGYENRLCEMADLMPTLLSLCGLDNQRGYHWPQPKGYSKKGKNA